MGYNRPEMPLGSPSAGDSRDCTRGSERRKRRVAGAFLAALASVVAGCGSPAKSDQGWLTLLLQPAAGTDPFAPPAQSLYLSIRDHRDSSLVDEQTVPLADGSFAMEDVPTGFQVDFRVEVLEAGGGALARGNAGPYLLEKGTHQTVTVVLEEVP